jgi:hypothetical protein
MDIIISTSQNPRDSSLGRFRKYDASGLLEAKRRLAGAAIAAERYMFAA